MAATTTKAGEFAIEMDALLRECPVCRNDLTLEDFTSCSNVGSNHQFCKDCVVRHAKATLEDFTLLAPGADGLRCMDVGCAYPISLDSLTNALDPLTLELLKQRMNDDKVAAEKRAEDGESADASEQTTSASRDANRQIEEKVSAIFIRRCPHCRRALTKSIGCAYVRCPCGTQLCFSCNRVFTQKNCAKTCVLRTTLAEDRAAMKRIYDGAQPEQKAHLRAIHPGIENYGARRYKIWDFCKERSTFLFSTLLLIALMEAVYWGSVLLMRAFDWGVYVVTAVFIACTMMSLYCCALGCIERRRMRS